MIYLSYSFQFLSFAAGMVSLFIAIQLFSRYKFHYLKSNIFLTAGYLIMMLLNSIGSLVNIENGGNNLSFSLYNHLLFFLLPLILLVILYHFRTLFFGIIDLSDSSKKYFAIIAIVFILIQSSILLFDEHFAYYAPVVPMMIIQIYFYVSVFKILFQFKSGIKIWKSNSWFKWLKTIYKIEINYFIIIILLTAVHLIGLIDNNLFMVFESFAAMIINPLTIYLFVKYHHDRYSENVNNFEKLVLQYEITEREKEIVNLVCEGKTNKEIAEILFLSPLTVRDHLSNIYRKTSVNNRTKLAGLFR